MCENKQFIPKVNEISIFREIAKNIVNPLEVVREALSNANDAEAREVAIKIFRNEANDLVLEVSDDGNGMNFDSIHKFFNLGDSTKTKDTIGEKGLGTKTYFKSKKIELWTQGIDGRRIYAEMNNPWDKLEKNQLPPYSVEEVEAESGNEGTIIRIIGYIVDIPERYFNIETLKDYIL